MKNSTATITTVAKINNKNILLIEDESGEKRIAVKPICEALGVDFRWQLSKIKDDEILGQLYKVSYTTGADGKQYEMATIPFEWSYGWLFSINPKKVAPEAKEKLILYKKECYEALFQHFNGYAEFVEYRQQQIDEKLTIVDEHKSGFSNAKTRLSQANEELNKARVLSFDDYKQMKSQTEIKFPEEGVSNEG